MCVAFDAEYRPTEQRPRAGAQTSGPPTTGAAAAVAGLGRPLVGGRDEALSAALERHCAALLHGELVRRLGEASWASGGQAEQLIS